MHEVDEKTFFRTIGQLDVHPTIEGPYPYTSVFFDKQRVEHGRIIERHVDGKYPPERIYLLRK